MTDRHVISRQRVIDHGEVFTPPKLASAMLDILPQDLFRRPNTTFLDPVCESGVFLREIACRLNDGLKDQMPDEQARINHILTYQNVIEMERPYVRPRDQTVFQTGY